MEDFALDLMRITEASFRGKVPVELLFGATSPQPAPEALFGAIAVQQAFATPQQVEECLKLHAQQPAGGRKTLGQIMVERNVLTEAQMTAIYKILAHRERKGIERRLSRLLIEKGVITEAQLEEAISLQRDSLRAGGKVVTLEEILVQKGILTAQQLRVLLKSIDPVQTAFPRASEGPVKECPQCLESIPQFATSCPWCGFEIATLREKPKCKACRAVLEKGMEFCRECGADGASGQPANPDRVWRCPSCSKYEAIERSSCLSCGASFWKAHTTQMLRVVRRAGRRVRPIVFAILAVTAVALLVSMNYTSISNWFGRLTQGEADDVRRDCEQLLQAVMSDDYTRASPLLSTEAAASTKSTQDLLRSFARSGRRLSNRTIPDRRGHRARIHRDRRR